MTSKTRVRENLSRSLRNSSRLPYDVAMRLAHDIETVALPILADSTVLTPDDLVEIVRSGSAPKQEAIAGRRDLDRERSPRRSSPSLTPPRSPR